MDVQMMNDEESENVDSDSQSNARGYCIEVYVKPDGTFSVSGPEYKEESGEEPEDEGQSAESLPDVLKLILQTIKENPVGNNPADEMQAGFMAGPAGKMGRPYKI